MDSTLDGFEKLTERAAREAHARDLVLGLETVQNLTALGVVDSGEAMSRSGNNVRSDGGPSTL